MGHSRAGKAVSRERILDLAARQIRQEGLDSLSISDLMRSADLTHGGFYGHFPSRAALIAAALDLALDHGTSAYAAAKAGGSVEAIVNPYLNSTHRDDPGGGCAIGALSGDVGRTKDEAVRALMAQRLEANFEAMAQALGDDAEAADTAVLVWCAMVGAINLARVFRGEARSEQILQLARGFILDLDARGRAAEAFAAPNDLSTLGD